MFRSPWESAAKAPSWLTLFKSPVDLLAPTFSREGIHTISDASYGVASEVPETSTGAPFFLFIGGRRQADGYRVVEGDAPGVLFEMLFGAIEDPTFVDLFRPARLQLINY